LVEKQVATYGYGPEKLRNSNQAALDGRITYRYVPVLSLFPPLPFSTHPICFSPFKISLVDSKFTKKLN
jgi:hypothetical protein